MKRRIIFTAAVMMIFSACESKENITETETVSVTAEQTAAAAVTVTQAVTAKPPKSIAPLTPSKKQAYFRNEDFSVTAELKSLRSSLYYPDIIAKMGADPELFAVEVSVKVKNLAYEDRSFDCSALSLLSGGSGMYLFDTECEEAEDIPSGKTAFFDIRFLCNISQAAEISGMTYSGSELEIKERFIPEDFAEVIEKQSADDVREYLYRPYVSYNSLPDHFGTSSAPAAFEVCILGKAGENREYFAVKYMAYNRSDYALLLEPDAFDLYCLYDGTDNMEKAEKAYISTDKKLIYEPTEADKKLKNIGKLYEIPEFLCMNPEGETEFIILYKAEGHIKKWMLSHNGSHSEPYYGSYNSIHALECDYE